MKFVLILIACIGFFSCSSAVKTIKSNDAESSEKKELKAGAVMKNKPASIDDFIYDESIRTFFHKSISDNRKKTVSNTLKKGQRINEDKDKYSRQIELIESSKVDPLWFQYFKEEIHGRLQLSLRISSKGFPDIIIVEEGIRSDIDLIACQYVAKYRFKPAVGRRSGNEVSAWIRISNQY